MTRHLGLFGLRIGLLFCASIATAQQLETTELKMSVDILSGVLREGLGVNETPGLFGLNEPRVDSFYLQGQGVVMKIQTPLARRRNRVNINALASSIYRLPNRSNPFAAVQRSSTPGASSTSAFSLQQDNLGGLYQSLIEEIQSIDVSAVIDRSIRQASSLTRSLRELGEIDQESFNNLQQEFFSMREELGSMREDMMQRIDDLRQMENEPPVVSVTATDEVQFDLRENIESLKLTLEQLKTNTAVRAANLSEQYESAKAKYEARWIVEISELEARLYALLCDYGATLRDLPDDEYLTVVFSDLGEKSETDARTDKIHILSKTDLSRCQSRGMDAVELQQRSSSYSY